MFGLQANCGPPTDFKWNMLVSEKKFFYGLPLSSELSQADFEMSSSGDGRVSKQPIARADNIRDGGGPFQAPIKKKGHFAVNRGLNKMDVNLLFFFK